MLDEIVPPGDKMVYELSHAGRDRSLRINVTTTNQGIRGKVDEAVRARFGGRVIGWRLNPVVPFEEPATQFVTDANEGLSGVGGRDRLVIGMEVGEFSPAEEAVDLFVKLFKALNAYHIASGGQGLEVDDWHVLVPNVVTVGGGDGGEP
jgi:hypothetical protein